MEYLSNVKNPEINITVRKKVCLRELMNTLFQEAVMSHADLKSQLKGLPVSESWPRRCGTW